MELVMNAEAAVGYSSGSQRARVVTELWGEDNLFCAQCDSNDVKRLANNTHASDYQCSKCQAWYQLKSQRTRFKKCITDGAYEAMMSAIRRDQTPNFLFMQYDSTRWIVRNLLLIPQFAFPSSAIIKRKPLALTARRAGWVGCNIALASIPQEARIPIVLDGNITSPDEVRLQYRKVAPLKELRPKERGWTLDVLNGIRKMKKQEFTTAEAYSLVPLLEELHPDNRHVRDKLRQQLQFLRDAGMLIHVERGRWRLPDA